MNPAEQSVLSGQVALITGCGRQKGLGRSIARALTQAGAQVAVSDVTAIGSRNSHENDDNDGKAGWTGLPSLVEELEGIGGRALALVGHVGKRVDAERMMADAVDFFGKVDILVNNAAAPQGADRTWAWEVPEEAFDQVMEVNTKGVFLMSSAMIRHLLGRGAPGRIINVASAAGRRGFAQRAAYSASKFAVVGLTQAMALELAPSGITVNAVCPGSVDTARTPYREALSAEATGTVGRIGVPDDIARAVLFLADPAADYITGECLNVNGGAVMT